MKHPGLMAAFPGNLLALNRKLPALGGAELSLDDLQGKEDIGEDRVRSQAHPCRSSTRANIKHNH